MDSITCPVTPELQYESLRARQSEFATKFGLDLLHYLKIVRSCTAVEVITIFELLRTSKFRSAYRENCSSKVRRWLEDDYSLGKPLSPWEFTRCAPTWRIPYSLPTLQ